MNIPLSTSMTWTIATDDLDSTVGLSPISEQLIIVLFRSTVSIVNDRSDVKGSIAFTDILKTIISISSAEVLVV